MLCYVICYGYVTLYYLSLYYIILYCIKFYYFIKVIEFGAVPHNFGVSVITPVVKNTSSSLHDVNNYRPVAIISVISKAFESLINLHFGQFFTYHENQFGFSVGRGCNKAIFAFNNTEKLQ